MVIYRVINAVNRKSYIGQTSQDIKRRMSQHRSEARRLKPVGLFHKAIARHGWENFTVEIMERPIDDADLDMAERFWIKTCNTLKPHGYNLESGGNQNKRLSAERKIAIGDSHRGKKLSSGHVEAIRSANVGNKHTLGLTMSPETRAKMSASHSGKNLSAEHVESLRKPKTTEARANIAKAIVARCSKLTFEIAETIRADHLAGEKIVRLAERHLVSRPTIRAVLQGRIYALPN